MSPWRGQAPPAEPPLTQVDSRRAESEHVGEEEGVQEGSKERQKTGGSPDHLPVPQETPD